MTTNVSWNDDKLKRKAEAADLIQFLTARMRERADRGISNSYVLNLDAGWGHGKTFFLRRMGEDLRKAGHAVALVNAWETDFSDDPMLAILSAIEESLQPFLKGRAAVKNAWRTAVRSGGTLAVSLAKRVASRTAERYVGNFADEIADQIAFGPDEGSSDKDATGAGAGAREGIERVADSGLTKLLAAFRNKERSIRTFRDQIGALTGALGQDGTRRYIFVLVDELDRCRPSYAIKLLEAAKHLFDTQGVVFLVATDTDQLRESIKAVYGASFDSRRYLYRFFDRTYRFREPDRSDFIDYLLDRYGIETENTPVPPQFSVAQFSLAYFDTFELSLRDIEQCFDVFATFRSIWRGHDIQLGYLWPLIILNHLDKREEYRSVSQISGPLDPKKHVNVNIFSERVIHRASGNVSINHLGTIDLLNEYIRMNREDLPRATQQQGENAARDWVISQLRSEIQSLHRGQVTWEPKMYSVMREYSKYVELAVQFEMPAAETMKDGERQ